MRLREINKKTNSMQGGLCNNVPFTLTFAKACLKLEFFPLCSLWFKSKFHRFLNALS